jgi:ADP-ribose pyrophosphatase
MNDADTASKRTLLHAGKHLQFLRTDLGWEYVERVDGGNGVAIIGITSERKMLLVEQYRAPLNNLVIELPAGLVSPFEDGIAAARRELLEETGYTCEEVELLCRGTTSPGLTDELNSIYLASGLVCDDSVADDVVLEDGVTRHLKRRGISEEGESITVYEVPTSGLRSWLDRQQHAAKLIDLKVYLGLFLYPGA